ncbi:MAG TPA: DUF3784 domain-containing protein [Candidatus Limnocylindrales bacterium]|nr:DUF3784 domain-containing protein [Candidatus Limnocylindrales bacterium]
MVTTYPLSVPQEANWFSLITMLVILAMGPLVWWQKRGSSRVAAIIGVSVIAFVSVLLFYLLLVAPRLTEVTIGDGQLIVNTPPYARLDIGRPDILAAYVVDWRDVEALAPALRTGGTAIGDYRTGNFQLRNGAAAVIMATGSRVLVLQLADRFVLLAPDNFDAFLQEIEQRVIILGSPPLADLVVNDLVKTPGLPPLARIIFLVAGLLIIFLGYLVRFKKMLFLLSGYDERKVKDKDALAHFAGNFVMLIGVTMVTVQFFNFRGMMIYSVIMMPVTVYAIYRMNKL